MTIYVSLPYQVKNVNDIINFLSKNGGFEISEEQINFYHNVDKDQKFCHINLQSEREEQILISYFDNNKCKYPSTRNFIIKPQKKNTKIIIKKLPDNLSKEIILEKLSKYGKVDSVKYQSNQYGGYYATVYMKDEDEAQKVIENLNEQKWSENDNRTLIVEIGSENLTKYLVNSEDKEHFLEQKNYHLVTETVREFVTLLCNKISTSSGEKQSNH